MKALLLLVTIAFLTIDCSKKAEIADTNFHESKSCVDTAVDISQPPIKYSLSETFSLIPERKEKFKNTLELSLAIRNIQSNLVADKSQKTNNFDIIAYFTNISSSSIIIRIPQTIGFVSDPGISEGANFDLTIHLHDKDGNPIGALNSYAGLDEKKVTEKDFVFLKPNDVFCIPIKSDLPTIFIDNVGYYSLPNGTYLLSVGYENYMIGYSVPATEIPPSNLGFIDESDWHLTHDKQADINAWIGRTISSRTRFDISD